MNKKWGSISEGELAAEEECGSKLLYEDNTSQQVYSQKGDCAYFDRNVIVRQWQGHELLDRVTLGH